MSTRLGVDTETVTDWTELASRENDSLAIGLYWSKSSGRVKVGVIDDLLEQAFAFDVDPADALSAFRHPFAYAPRDDCSLGDTVCDPFDLQTAELKRST